MMTTAVVLEGPRQLGLRRLPLTPPTDGQVVVVVEQSAISTGTERLLWTGEMPAFPGMGYPLVPGYESVGRVVEADAASGLRVGDRVFVPGASCFGSDVRGLFGGAASRLVVTASRVRRIDPALGLGDEAVLLALAATAQHALHADHLPDLIVGHGVLGRLLARLVVAAGGSPTVWEKTASRAAGAEGYAVLSPGDDPRKDYAAICDVSGDGALVDALVGRLARGGELTLAGFYPGRVSFDFPPAFMKEARFRIAAEWKPEDLDKVLDLVADGSLSLTGLVTHRRPFDDAAKAYETAFCDATCLKMLIDWRSCND